MIFDHAADASGARATYTLRESIGEFVDAVPGKFNDFGLSRDERTKSAFAPRVDGLRDRAESADEGRGDRRAGLDARSGQIAIARSVRARRPLPLSPMRKRPNRSVC